MTFEFDENKSKINKEKHGIDFIEAQKLFNHQVEILDTYSLNEKRFLAIGFIGEKCWCMVFTLRNENIRIISVRRCRKKEKEYYENNSSRI